MKEGFEENQIQKSLKPVSAGSGASLKGIQRGTKARERAQEVREIKLSRQSAGLLHFWVRYAPMVRLAAPSAARPKTVLMEGQEQLKADSPCLSYSSTKASWETDGERQGDG